MQTFELETQIDSAGVIRLPERYRHAYGRSARIVLSLPDEAEDTPKPIDPMRYAGTLDWPVDGLDYQAQCRDEWP